MKNTNCIKCKKEFSYESATGKVNCPHCWERYEIEIEPITPDEVEEQPKEPTTEEQLLYLKGQLDKLIDSTKKEE